MLASEERDEVVARYARSSGLSRRWRVTWGVAGVLALTGVVSYIGLKQATPALTATVLGYQVASDGHSVDIRFQVDNRKSDRAATCTVRARASNGDEVGRLDVPVTAGSRTRELTATVKTSSRAITGEVVECRLA